MDLLPGGHLMGMLMMKAEMVIMGIILVLLQHQIETGT
jgi:hypothetical protein